MSNLCHPKTIDQGSQADVTNNKHQLLMLSLKYMKLHVWPNGARNNLSRYSEDKILS